MPKDISLDNQVLAELSPIKISSYAFDKANYVSRRVCELAGEPLEVGFYLIGDPLSKTDGEAVIDDIYIGSEQNVKKSHVNVTPRGKMLSTKSIQGMGKRVVGWGHSHAESTVYYSDQDDDTIEDLVKQWGMKRGFEAVLPVSDDLHNSLEYACRNGRKGIKLTIEGADLFISSDMFDEHSEEYMKEKELELSRSKDVEINFFYGMTFNRANDRPYTTIAYRFLDDIKIIEEGVDFQLIKDEREIDTAQLDQDLISRVLELKERYDNFNKTLEDDFEEFKKHYQIVSSSLNYLTSPQTEKKHEVERSTEFLESLTAATLIASRYKDMRNLMTEDLEQKLDEYRPKMMNMLNEFMNKVLSKKDLMKERYFELIEHKKNTGMIKKCFSGSINSLIKNYDRILGTLKRYRGASKNGKKG